MRTVSITVLSIIVLMMFALVIFFSLSGCSSTSHDAHKHGAMHMDVQDSEQTNCPVMGGEIAKEFYADQLGKRIYFCCEMCIDKFKEKPEKYMEKL